MKIYGSVFYNTAIRLSWRDILTLVLGGDVKGGGYVIGLRNVPDNGCPCVRCKAARGEA